ncbi:hypothetical protein HRbin11_01440 [bacterium HR11]|nr:hypothetical protein HRbin11_01440 [bacterium HR11]
MAVTLEERVAYLEGRVEEQSRLGTELREMVAHLDQKVDRFREELMAQIRAVDQKVDRFREELSAQVQALDQKMTRYFTWLIGLYIAGLLAIMAALLGR